MKKLLKELGVTVTLINKREKRKIFSVIYNNNEIGHIETKDGWNTWYSTDHSRLDKYKNPATGKQKEFVECVVSLLTYHKIYMRTNVTEMARGIMSPNVIVKISDIFILHNKDLGDPSTSIHCMCLVTYVVVRPRVWQACSVRRIFALIDLTNDRFITLDGKELEASNTKEMIGHVRTLIFGEQR